MIKPIDNPKELAGKYTLLMIDGEVYGIKTDEIKSIETIPKIRRVPKAPDFIEGVANIEGRIIPIINLFIRLDLFESGIIETAKKAINKQALVLVKQDLILYGIIVDQIRSIENIPADLIEPVNPIMIKKEAPYIAAMAKKDGELIYLLNLSAIILAGVTIKKDDEESYHDFSIQLSELLKPKHQKSVELFLSFTISEETYALHVSVLKKVTLSHGLESVSSCPGYVAGVKTEFGRTLPVIDLAKKLDVQTIPYNEKSRIIWVEVNTHIIGILVNSIDSLFSIEDKNIKTPPQNVVKNGTNHIKAIALLDNGKQMLSILNENQILTKEEITEFTKLKEVQMEALKSTSEKKIRKKIISLLTFTIADLELAIYTKDVDEVILMQDVKKIPRVPDYIKGVIPFKEDLIPIIDLYLRFDLEYEKKKQKSRIILIKTDRSHYGIEADTISDIINIDENSIMPSEKIMQHIDKTFVSGVAIIKDTDRFPIILNLDNLY